MTTFQILWVAAGAMLGWMVPSYVGGAIKARVPATFLIMGAFVGGVVAWTLVR